MQQETCGKSVATDPCTHDDVFLDADTNKHLIECNQCGRWWRCNGNVQDLWRDFIRYNRLDGSDPSTVNIKCSPAPWIPR